MEADPLLPPHLSKDHPVAIKRYSLYTHAIAEMAKHLQKWIDCRVEGATIFGPSRFGKSSAVNHWLHRLLAQRYGGNVPLVIWSHQDMPSASSSAALHTALLRAIDSSHVKTNRTGSARLTQLLERLVEIASRGWGSYLVLVVDEAQDISQREWIWLVQLHATLEREGVQLCIVSIASFQYNEAPRQLAMTGSAHAAARFMLHEAPFRGLRSLAEVRFVLAAYDNTPWPSATDPSFTAAVAPRGWEEGLRLVDSAEHLWTALHELLPSGYGGPIEFPMQSIALSARQILLRAGTGHWEQATNSTAWQAAVADTGHQRLMSIVSAHSRRRPVPA